MKELVKFFGLTFSALLPLINPLGSALVFLGLVGRAPLSVFRSLAKRIAISTTLFLIVIDLIGTAMLNFFGISLAVVQVSGGLVLAGMGRNLLIEKEVAPTSGPLAPSAPGQLERKIFFPFTFPLTAGPGCIVVMVTLSAHASVGRLLPSLAAHAGIVLAVIVLSVAVWFCYGHAPAITRRVSPETAQGILRVIAFVLLHRRSDHVEWTGSAAEIDIETLEGTGSGLGLMSMDARVYSAEDLEVISGVSQGRRFACAVRPVPPRRSNGGSERRSRGHPPPKKP